ncbi:MAG TPA: 30S ribosomal protein S6 [Herpetosiphonaceae bacterium]
MRARNYELMYIIDPTVGGDEDYTAIAERVQGYIANAGATVQDGEAIAPTGRRKLAYAIRHNGQDLTEGFYVFTRFEAQPQQIPTIERDLKLTEQIMRYLLTVVE